MKALKAILGLKAGGLTILCVVARQVDGGRAVVIMMSRVDRVNRINGVNLDVNSPWLQRRNRDDQSGSGGSFKETLQNSMARRRREEVAAQVSEAAVWESSGATQSLFYENGVDLDFFYRLRTGTS